MDSLILPAPGWRMKRPGLTWPLRFSVVGGSKPGSHLFRFLPSPLQTLQGSAFAQVWRMSSIHKVCDEEWTDPVELFSDCFTVSWNDENFFIWSILIQSEPYIHLPRISALFPVFLFIFCWNPGNSSARHRKIILNQNSKLGTSDVWHFRCYVLVRDI